MIDISQHELEVVRNILDRFMPDAEIFVFGSRIHGTAKPWSDLDLAITAKSAIDWMLLAEIKEAFQESGLSFRVDLLDWNDISPAFRKAIETNGYEPLA
ncbi:MAG: nucleotidyltransferase domain-containing protein [Chlorobiaceae bacterium]|nr:nucleotidyltransferase domain-containing protein [Chlorobiaceae bacterium]